MPIDQSGKPPSEAPDANAPRTSGLLRRVTDKKLSEKKSTELIQELHGKKQPSTDEILNKAVKRAMGGGISGGIAMGLNVGALMWLRTTINYQYRYGTTTTEAFRALYNQGGIRRFYRGVGPALIQGPMSRFGDTAANTGTLVLLDSYETTKNLPMYAKTVCASLTAASWRIFLMPIDTMKTIMQVEGKDGISKLGAKFRTHGPKVLYHGALATFTASAVGHYPWFATYNILQEKIPQYDDTLSKLGRNAFIGFCASVTSDCVSNSVRVCKVYKQTNTESISYPEVVKRLVKEGGVIGLMTRGLKTKILANGLQGIMFSVLWKALQPKVDAMIG